MKAREGTRSIPLFGARKMARELLAEIDSLSAERDELRAQLGRLGGLTILQLEAKRSDLEREIAAQSARLQKERADAAEVLRAANVRLDETRKAIVVTEELTLLQEAGVYRYRHPLTDAVAYQEELARIDERIKAMVRKDGGAVLAATDWTVNGSAAQGRAMVRDFSKLLLRAFNAEADNLGWRAYLQCSHGCLEQDERRSAVDGQSEVLGSRDLARCVITTGNRSVENQSR